jgi:hypothetical protein
MGYNFLKIVNELPKVIDRLECLNVCDYGLVLAKVGVRGKSSFARGIKGFQLTGVNTEHINIFQGHNNLYDSIYDMEKFWQGRYDMVLLMDMYYKAGIDKVYELVRDALKISKYVMLCVPFPAVDGQGWSAECFSALGIVKEFFVEEQKYFIIGAGKVVKESEVNIYVVTHKKFIPIYGDFDRIRIPIQAGAALNPSFGYERDDNGDNISTLNPYINECTAIYWVWKNVRCRYVGFEHYRRVFLSNPYSHDPDYILGENDIKRYLCDEKYDFIVASNANNYPITTYENLRDDILPEAFIRYKVLFEERINEVAPEYMDVYMECFNGFSFYPANMFITSWERFDEYCKWFFGIVLSMVDVENLDSYDTYNKRVVGFFAERLLTVWIMKRGYRVMEMPYMCKEIRIENFNENDKN